MLIPDDATIRIAASAEIFFDNLNFHLNDDFPFVIRL